MKRGNSSLKDFKKQHILVCGESFEKDDEVDNDDEVEKENVRRVYELMLDALWKSLQEGGGQQQRFAIVWVVKKKASEKMHRLYKSKAWVDTNEFMYLDRKKGVAFAKEMQWIKNDQFHVRQKWEWFEVVETHLSHEYDEQPEKEDLNQHVTRALSHLMQQVSCNAIVDIRWILPLTLIAPFLNGPRDDLQQSNDLFWLESLRSLLLPYRKSNVQMFVPPTTKIDALVQQFRWSACYPLLQLFKDEVSPFRRSKRMENKHQSSSTFLSQLRSWCLVLEAECYCGDASWTNPEEMVVAWRGDVKFLDAVVLNVQLTGCKDSLIACHGIEEMFDVKFDAVIELDELAQLSHLIVAETLHVSSFRRGHSFNAHKFFKEVQSKLKNSFRQPAYVISAKMWDVDGRKRTQSMIWWWHVEATAQDCTGSFLKCLYLFESAEAIRDLNLWEILLSESYFMERVDLKSLWKEDVQDRLIRSKPFHEFIQNYALEGCAYQTLSSDEIKAFLTLYYSSPEKTGGSFSLATRLLCGDIENVEQRNENDAMNDTPSSMLTSSSKNRLRRPPLTLVTSTQERTKQGHLYGNRALKHIKHAVRLASQKGLGNFQ